VIDLEAPPSGRDCAQRHDAELELGLVRSVRGRRGKARARRDAAPWRGARGRCREAGTRRAPGLTRRPFTLTLESSLGSRQSLVVGSTPTPGSRPVRRSWRERGLTPTGVNSPCCWATRRTRSSRHADYIRISAPVGMRSPISIRSTIPARPLDARLRMAASIRRSCDEPLSAYHARVRHTPRGV